MVPNRNGAVTSAVLVHLRVEPAHFDWRWRERPALALLVWEALVRDPPARLRRIQLESTGTTINFRPAAITHRDIRSIGLTDRIQRADDLAVSRLELDRLAGLAPGYSGKLLGNGNGRTQKTIWPVGPESTGRPLQSAFRQCIAAHTKIAGASNPAVRANDRSRQPKTRRQIRLVEQLYPGFRRSKRGLP
jgi:hypothetical protein